MTGNQSLKKVVKAIKFRYELTQAEVAEKLACKSTYLSDMINGRVPLSESFSDRLHLIFRVDKNFLLTGEGDIFLPSDDEILQIRGSDLEETTAQEFAVRLMKMYTDKEIYPASIVEEIKTEKDARIKEIEKKLDEKDAKIEELQKRIWELEQGTKSE